mgnify:FL=1
MNDKDAHKEFVKSALNTGGTIKAPSKLQDAIMDTIHAIDSSEMQQIEALRQLSISDITPAPESFSEQVADRLSVNVRARSKRLRLSESSFWIWTCFGLFMLTGTMAYLGGLKQEFLRRIDVYGLINTVPSTFTDVYIYGMWMILISLIWWLLDTMISSKSGTVFNAQLHQ